MRLPRIDVELPAWLGDALPDDPERPFGGDGERMAWAVDLARENVRRETGGPFAAAVFDRERGTLVAPGVNLVVGQRSSVLHAEVVALMAAQRRLGSHDLAAPGLPDCELVATAEPCAMCYGAVPWSGVTRLVCGARSEDARAVGFDEGEKPEDWPAALERRGIEVARDVGRAEARAVLEAYAESGGPIYNSSRGS
ncbi:MAG: nucleoside deaminase [Gemmatimonadota bacterium]